MRSLLFLAALLLASCDENTSKEKKDPPPTDTTIKATDTATRVVETPPIYKAPGEDSVNAALKARYANQWHVLNDKEASWMKDAFDYFIVPKRREYPDYPYITRGDFDADGKADVAAVVTDSLRAKYQIAILLGKDQALLWKEDVLEDAALSTVAKSDIDGMDGGRTKKVKLKGDGINVEYYEKASFVLYWDKSSFKRIQTGD